MVARLIRIYTPFICALVAIIHGVLCLKGYEGHIFYILSDLAGHSMLLVAYVLSTCKRMCFWYKVTCWLLILIHLLNLVYVFFGIEYYTLLHIGLTVNFAALITFLIYRLKVGITKILC